MVAGSVLATTPSSGPSPVATATGLPASSASRQLPWPGLITARGFRGKGPSAEGRPLPVRAPAL